MVKNGPIKILHVSVGLFAITAGLLSITLGFNMDYYRADHEGLATALMIFVLFVLVYVIIQPIIDLISTTKKVI